MSLVSVIIPMYNAAETIEAALNSVVEQTYKNLEVIVVNDGSKDNSVEIVESFIRKKQLSYIHLINKINGGVSSARNAGLKTCKGDFVAFLDSDDQWLPAKIEKQIKAFNENPQYGMIGTLISGSSANAGQIISIPLSRLIYKNHFQPSTVMLKKDVADFVGLFDETQKYAEEGNYFMRIANSFHCGLMLEKLIIYGDDKPGFGHSGLSANLIQMEKGELRNLNYAFSQRYINILQYISAFIYSIIKYARRIIIVKIIR